MFKLPKAESNVLKIELNDWNGKLLACDLISLLLKFVIQLNYSWAI